MPAVVVKLRCWPSGGAIVVVVVLVVVVVVVVVGTVTVRATSEANVSMTLSSGASCEPVPHFLSDEVNFCPAFVPQSRSTVAPFLAAVEWHLMTSAAFLPAAVSFLALHTSGPGAPPLTAVFALATKVSTCPSTVATSASVRQSPFSCAFANALVNWSVAFCRQASSTGTPFCTALA